ncbi:MAG: DUF721 domain-containing protein [Treponema sp.]|nr:DUF721 domain-containing protein [Treponema sp.]MBQ4235736.1 DUF721 domain-containing protein [Treponema sp.]
MNEEIVNINELIHKTFNNISVEGSKNASRIVSAWNSVLSRIKSVNPIQNPNEGENLIDHSRVVDLKNGVLLIEADHPGWISLLQFHKKFIIKGMQMAVSDVPINSLAFRVRGSQASISSSSGSQNEVRRNIEKRIEIEEQNLSRTVFQSKPVQKSYKTDELAPELAKIFADLKNDMMEES